jgi:hypothetical protein
MNGHHGGPVPDADADGFGHGVGDVVKLEVQENVFPQSLDVFEKLWPFRCEELQADLKDPGVLELADESKGVFLVFDVEGDNDAFAVIDGMGHVNASGKKFGKEYGETSLFPIHGAAFLSWRLKK